MAALHHDFDLAVQLGSNSETQKTYGEDNTNMLYFLNLLQQMSKKAGGIGGGNAGAKNNQTEGHFGSDFTQGSQLYNQLIKNPYLGLFYQIMCEKNLK